MDSSFVSCWHTNGRIKRHVWRCQKSFFPVVCKILTWHEFLESFSKIHQTFLYMILSAEGWTERGMGILNRISQFLYAIKNALHIHRRPAKCLALLQTLEPITRYCQWDQHSYKRGTLADTNIFISEVPDFKYHIESQSFWNILKNCLVTLLITSL